MQGHTELTNVSLFQSTLWLPCPRDGMVEGMFWWMNSGELGGVGDTLRRGVSELWDGGFQGTGHVRGHSRMGEGALG